jgi:hypothetical protein
MGIAHTALSPIEKYIVTNNYYHTLTPNTCVVTVLELPDKKIKYHSNSFDYEDVKEHL